ncbi:MAG: HPF/RaiA family ribosome-associated protein, partial [Methylovirgula sp.]
DQTGRRSRSARPCGRLDEKRPYTAEKPASPHHSNAQSDRLLEKFSPRVTSCRVVVTGPQTRRRRGGLFEVELRIAMPEHNDIVVDTLHGDAPQHEHALVAIRDAFDAAVRQIEDLAREMRDQVKGEVAAMTGRGIRAKYGPRPCGLADRFARRSERCWSRGQNSSLDRPAIGIQPDQTVTRDRDQVVERRARSSASQLRLSGYSAILTTSTLLSFR